jgi:small-conductance mechanosensitive channel
MDSTSNLLTLFQPRDLPYAALIILIAMVLARVVRKTFEALGRRFTDKRLLINQAGSFVRFGILLIGGITAALTVLEITPEVLLAVGGTVAVSVGFALKDFVSSIVAGLIILVDRPFQVGDRVSFDGWYGEITHIGLRSVKLMTLDDTQVTIPNNKFLTDPVASGNAGSVEMMVQMDFYIGLDQDLATAKNIVTEALTSSRFFSTARPWGVTVSQILQDSYFALRLRGKAYVLDVRFEKAFETDVTERVIEGFAAAEIRPPAILHRNAADPTPAPIP